MLFDPNSSEYERVIKVGKKALKDDGEGAKMCFHIAPWNSIDHLHLHAIGRSKSVFLCNIYINIYQYYYVSIFI